MRSLVIFAVLSLASAKPTPGGIWGAPAVSSLGYVHQPVVQQYAVAQPVVHAAPAVIAKPAATSYASFQQIVHPVAQHVVHAAPVYSAPVVHAQPIVQTVAQPVVHAAPVYSQPVVQTYAQPYVSSVGHGW